MGHILSFIAKFVKKQMMLKTTGNLNPLKKKLYFA